MGELQYRRKNNRQGRVGTSRDCYTTERKQKNNKQGLNTFATTVSRSKQAVKKTLTVEKENYLDGQKEEPQKAAS